MKILVTGGRRYGQTSYKYDDELVWERDDAVVAYFNETLDAIHARKPITCVVHGDASGADTLAKEWAMSRCVEHKPYPADWKLGPYAGPLRNGQMLDQNKDIKCVLAFPGGKGTKNCIQLAKVRKVNVLLC